MLFKDLKIGVCAEEKYLVTEDKIIKFADISGDYNPIHLDDSYAKKTIFKKRIAHGLMSASLFSGIFGTKLPGEGSIYISQTLKFKHPVFIGDIVKARVEIININKRSKKILFKTECIVENRKVITGEAEVLYNKY
jgi:3-hydroxybutyryl-CoA dehydratase